MPVSLENVRTSFLKRLKRVEQALQRHSLEPKVVTRFDRNALQEGLISHLWQFWNVFCRDVVIASTQGALTTGGTVTTSPYSARSDAEIASLARTLARRERVGNITPLAGSYLEPTWGDSGKLNLILSGIGCTNSATLLSAFSVGTTISDLQICRNACAHFNLENIRKVQAARVRYKETSLGHPSGLMFWVEPATNDYVWRSWIEDMDIVSEFAIS